MRQSSHILRDLFTLRHVRRVAILASLASLALCCVSVVAQSRIDTIRKDNGVYNQVNTMSAGWEESVILQPGAPCRIIGISVYYVGAGVDTLRITGDASEGTIPPTVWAYAYNTLWSSPVDVSATGWKYIQLNVPLEIGGFDRVVVQHLIRPGAPQFGQTNAQVGVTSYLYDPTTPNPDFLNIPGIYYAARGDYMVRLHVEYAFPAPSQGSAPMPAPSFVDVTRQVALTNADNTLIRADMASIVDYNNDGFEDVVIGSQVFRNDAGSGFTRVSTGITAGATSWADFDNDGDADCFAMHGFGNDKLYRQNADGTFSDLGNAGIVNNAPAVTPLWLDYNADGALDLFIANGRTEQSGQEVYFADKLFRNKSDGTFEDVTVASGIAAFEPAPFYDTWGASICDYNNDGRPDIFVATYRLAPDKLYKNNGDGTFSDVSVTTGIQGIPTSVPTYFGHGMGSDWGDLNNDGFVDAAVGNLGHPDSRAQYSNPSMLWASGGPPAYSFQPRVRKRGGVTFKEMNAGMCFFDYDHDGKLDLWHGQISYSPFGSDSTRYSHLYRQTSNEWFADATWEMGLRIHGAWTAVRFDFDRDGDLDLLCASGTENVKLFRNDAARGNAITIRLKNSSIPKISREGFGARVKVVAGSALSYRWLPGTVSGGRASQMSNELHVGIGDASKADSVVVTWSDGHVSVLQNVLANSYVLLDRGGAHLSNAVESQPRLRSPSNNKMGLIGTATLQWHAVHTNSGPSASYILEIANDSLFTSPLAGIPQEIADTSYTFTSGAHGSTYFWRVRRNAPGARKSVVWNFTLGSPMPSTPTLLAPSPNAAEVKTKKAVFAWTRSSFATYVKPVAMYDVQIATSADFTTIVKEVTGTTDSTFTGADLATLTTYYWRVRARTTGIVGDWTNAVAFTTYDKTPAVALIAPADSADGQPVRARFTWQHVQYEDAGFVLEFDTLETFATTVPRSRADTTTLSPVSLKPGRTYYWRVAAKNDEGQGPWSPVWRFTVDASSGVVQPLPDLVEEFNVRCDALTGECTIQIELRKSAQVQIAVYDLAMRAIAEITSATYPAVQHQFQWSSSSAASGAYFIVLTVDGRTHAIPYFIQH